MSTSFRLAPMPRRKPAKPVPDNMDFIPQAILSVPLSRIAETQELPIEHGVDDLDEFDGVTLYTEGMAFPVAIRHYAGHPPGTVTLYFPLEVRNLADITQSVALTVHSLNLNSTDILWQRKDNPEL